MVPPCNLGATGRNTGKKPIFTSLPVARTGLSVVDSEIVRVSVFIRGPGPQAGNSRQTKKAKAVHGLPTRAGRARDSC